MTTASNKILGQDFGARFWGKILGQDFGARFLGKLIPSRIAKIHHTRAGI
jgi:hypothetical protein